MRPDKNRLDFLNMQSVNDIHDEALIQEFIDGIGRKVLILTPSFPFVFIGKIEDVIEDHILIDVKTTTIGELENRLWHVHIHQVEAFYIETRGLPRIPELRDI